ncbi:hypothetical protein DYBT9275_01457 [Dyadobacter sp. CECT 9275]|uniref:Uncharacterized protein n=1 Tax=Dyadobacter helix TaxID=2822344 RepID=A0A916J9U8_9BACT|nr:hypothetical protein [Dyadobacter sp. CECT 9275]CAG4994742.1 hypothetical protein DYBT9275_01457 [Dyadobacter sp. CECT 9275]
MSEQTQLISEDGGVTGGKPETHAKKNIKPAAAVGAGAMAGIGAVAIDAYGSQKTGEEPEVVAADSTESVSTDTTAANPEAPVNPVQPGTPVSAPAGPPPHQELNPSPDVQVIPDNIKIGYASGNLSFDEAFEASRKEMGPGALFEWHGHLYHTCHPNEYAALPAEVKNQFNTLWVANEENVLDIPAETHETVPVHSPEEDPNGDEVNEEPIPDQNDPLEGDSDENYIEADSTVTGSELDLSYSPDDFDNNFEGTDEWVNPDDVV